METQDSGTVATVTAPQQANPISSESRNWSLLSHVSAFAMFFGIPSVVGPAVLWAIRKQDDPYIDFHGKEAVNFNLSFLLYGIAAALSMILLVGFILLPIVAVTWFVLVIVATVKAGAGEYYRYPFTIRFIQ